MKLLVLVSAGGAIGAALRFLTYQAFAGHAVARSRRPIFPWATLAVNVVGSFLMGLAMVTILERFDGSAELRAFIMAGILGGFTTFSAFSLDAVDLYRQPLTRGRRGLHRRFRGPVDCGPCRRHGPCALDAAHDPRRPKTEGQTKDGKASAVPRPAKGRRSQTITAAADSEMRLDRWFRIHFPEVGYSYLQKLLRSGSGPRR